MGRVINDNRIVYLEPNDIYGKVGDNPVTPDYTDYCIYCNLVVEKTSRLKNNYAGDSGDGKFGIEADLTKGQKGIQYTSFFQGESKKYNYLTTDYSDIHFNSIKKQTFVEGLQITGIDINYANWLVPTVTINMVDIRGAGIFGREEAVHVDGDIQGLESDEEGNIIDNIYGGFMSFPYPRYELHLKGYYGRAVTYHLTCSKFTGKLDADTGNFNISATFIGYEYGCLNDIPMVFAMAAPFTKSGRKYWNAHKNSSEWNLFLKDGKGFESPILLHDFFLNIQAALANKDEGESLADKVTDSSMEEINKEYNEKKSGLAPIRTYLDTFISAITAANGGTGRTSNIKIIDVSDDESNGDRVIAIFSKNESINITREACDAYNGLGDQIDLYNKTYPGDNVTPRMIPNHAGDKWENADRWTKVVSKIPLFFKRTNNGRKLVAVSTNGTEKQIKLTDGEDDLNDPRVKIRKLNSTDDISFNSKQSTIIYKNLKLYNGFDNYPYAAVIHLSKYNFINTILTSLETQLAEYENKVNDGTLIPITSITGGVSPFIGNFYKMVFCHVETFLHTLEECADNIYAEIDRGDREPKKLGVYNSAMSDVPDGIYNPGVNKGTMPPFPAIYKNYDGDVPIELCASEEATKSVGWVGDVKGSTPWQEQQLVEDYYNAIRLIDSTTSDVPWSEGDVATLKFNLLPCFINDNQTKDLFYTRDGMAFYASIMIELVIGAMNKNGASISADEAKLVGAIIAKNLFDSCVDKEQIVKSNPNGNKFAEDLEELATIPNPTGDDEARLFEFATGKSKDKIHRILTKENSADKMDYLYMPTVNGNAILPLNSFTDWTDLPAQYNFRNVKEDEGSTFIPKKVIDGPYVTTERGDKFIESISGVTQEEFVNSTMFSIWLDACNVETIQEDYDTYKEGGEDIGNFKADNFKKKILDKYWLMSDNYDKYHSVDVKEYKELGVNIPNFLSDDIDMSSTEVKKAISEIKAIKY